MSMPMSMQQDPSVGPVKPKFPWGAVIGGLSLVQGFLAQRDSNDKANQSLSLQERGLNLQEESARRLRQLYEKLYGSVSDAEKSGLFDLDAAEAQFEKDFAKDNKNALPNLATAQSIAGYRPGDSEAVRRENLLKKGLAESYRSGRLNARKKALAELVAAYQSTDPGLVAQSGGMMGSAYNRLSGAYGDAAERSRGQIPDIASLYQLYQLTQRRSNPGINNVALNNTDYNNLYA